jgi:hypothetical protein
LIKVGLLIKNPKLKYAIMCSLNEYNISFSELSSLENIPNDMNAIFVDTLDNTYLSAKLYKKFKIIFVTNDFINQKSLLKMLPLIFKKSIFNEVIIGIDPGKTYGFIVLVDGHILFPKQFTELEFLIKSLLHLIEEIPTRTLIIRIGNGGGEYFENLLSRLMEFSSKKPHKEISIEVVDESSLVNVATNFNGNNFPDNVLSAYIIALSRGKKIKF